MRIILSGGGSGEETVELDKLFADMLDKSKPLLYIPIAIDNIKHPYPECLTWLKKTFNNLGVKKYEMWSEEELFKFEDSSPKQFSGIYLGGGNTFYLLKKLKDNKGIGFIREAIIQDIPIYGGSAGAIIFSKSIKTSLNFDKNWVDLEDFEGINLIRDHYLWCHFEENKLDKIKNLILNQKIAPSIALTEKNGLFLCEGEICLVGTEPAWVFDKVGNRKKLEPGKKV